MPYTRDHLLLRFGGSSASFTEEWSCGVRLAPADPSIVGNALLAIASDALPAVAEACVDYVQDPAAGFSAIAGLDWVKLNPISAATGNYLSGSVTFEQEIEPRVTGAQPQLPLQIAYCVTLRGEFRRGPAARGRYYVPVGAQDTPVVTSTGVMPATRAQARADAAGTFLEAIQTLNVGGDPGESLRVRLFGDGTSGPRESTVQRVEVGNVYDTQRRRREQIEETYSNSATWTEPAP